MSAGRGGVHLIRALDVAQFPVELELEEGEPLGLGEHSTLHRLDRAGFAECGSKFHEAVTVADTADRFGRPITLCWYCFPRS